MNKKELDKLKEKGYYIISNDGDLPEGIYKEEIPAKLHLDVRFLGAERDECDFKIGRSNIEAMVRHFIDVNKKKMEDMANNPVKETLDKALKDTGIDSYISETDPPSILEVYARISAISQLEMLTQHYGLPKIDDIDKLPTIEIQKLLKSIYDDLASGDELEDEEYEDDEPELSSTPDFSKTTNFAFDKLVNNGINWDPRPILDLKFLKLRDDAVIPSYAHHGDSGMDLTAPYNMEPITLKPLERVKLDLGFALSTDVQGIDFLIIPKSGRAIKEGLSIVNAPGLIETNYKDEWGVVLVNLSNEDVVIEGGQKVAQCRISPVINQVVRNINIVSVKDKSELGSNNRGGGFGSTGIKG